MINLELKGEMDLLRETLHKLLSTDDYNVDTVLKASEQLDKIIVEYLKQK